MAIETLPEIVLAIKEYLDSIGEDSYVQTTTQEHIPFGVTIAGKAMVQPISAWVIVWYDIDPRTKAFRKNANISYADPGLLESIAALLR